MTCANILIVLVCACIQSSWSRSVSVSMNMSMTIVDGHTPKLNAAMLRTCMAETQLSMAELRRFRLSLLSHEPDVANDLNGENSTSSEMGNSDDDDDMGATTDGVDDSDLNGEGDVNEESSNEDNNRDNMVEYEDSTVTWQSPKRDKALNCFVYCLYERLGLVSDGVYMEEDLFAKLYAVVERERHLVRECMNLNSNNKCESSYKMHVCYSKLKTLEAEQRIRDILERIQDSSEMENNTTESEVSAEDNVKANEV